MTDAEFCAEARRRLRQQVRRQLDAPDSAILQIRDRMAGVDALVGGPLSPESQLDRIVHLLAWITLERVH